jgi:2-polyprenyl-3-methyl-5-hydroxy-6-metoxy-1,4-benzoquinol methylase
MTVSIDDRGKWNHAGSRTEQHRETMDRGDQRLLREVWRYAQWRLSRIRHGWTPDQRKHAKNVRFVRSLRSEPWMRAIERVQAEIGRTADADYETRYRIDEVHYWTLIAEWLHGLGPDWRGVRSLDAGCGFGTLALYMTELFDATSSACDMHYFPAVQALAADGRIEFKQSNIELDPLPWLGPFDVIVFTEVLEHLNFHPVPTLRKLRSALAENGRLFLSTPDAVEWGKVTTYYDRIESMPPPELGRRGIDSGEWEYVDAHVWQYSREELEHVVRLAGFQVVRWGYAPGVVHRHFNLELVPVR